MQYSELGKGLTNFAFRMITLAGSSISKGVEEEKPNREIRWETIRPNQELKEGTHTTWITEWRAVPLNQD